MLPSSKLPPGLDGRLWQVYTGWVIEERSMSPTKRIVIGSALTAGGTMIVVGPFLPWVRDSIEAGFGEGARFSYGALDGGLPVAVMLIFILGAVIAVMGVATLFPLQIPTFARRAVSIAVCAGAVLTVVISGINSSRVWHRVDQAENGFITPSDNAEAGDFPQFGGPTDGLGIQMVDSGAVIAL